MSPSSTPANPLFLVNEILALSQPVGSHAPYGRTPIKSLGFISCANAVDIKRAPFYGPCLITVLSGRKTIFDPRGPITCDWGCSLTVPAPSSFDLRNEPDLQSKQYRALIIPFAHHLLDDLSKIHQLKHHRQDSDVRVLPFERDTTLLASLKHYLSCAGNPTLVSHRLMEILLILVGKNTHLLSYTLSRDNWGQRVRALLTTDLSRDWEIGEVCKSLATTQSTLRRNLTKENAGFREILFELRMSSALGQLLQTSDPIYRIASDCGYQSVSRFTANFHRRFGLPPRDFREEGANQAGWADSAAARPAGGVG